MVGNNRSGTAAGSRMAWPILGLGGEELDRGGNGIDFAAVGAIDFRNGCISRLLNGPAAWIT